MNFKELKSHVDFLKTCKHLNKTDEWLVCLYNIIYRLGLFSVMELFLGEPKNE